MNAEVLVPLLVPLIVFSAMTTAIISLTKLITEYRLKKQLIEKGYVDKEARFLLERQSVTNTRLSSLKWGLVIFFAGLCMVILEFIPVEGDSPLPYGLFSLSVALGFLLYYFISKPGQVKPGV
jgi:hypothetical protein